MALAVMQKTLQKTWRPGIHLLCVHSGDPFYLSLSSGSIKGILALAVMCVSGLFIYE